MKASFRLGQFDKSKPVRYRGRIAPTPSGLMHLGHAKTFWIAQQRAAEFGGDLLLRVDDLDVIRCRNPHFLDDIVTDLHWFGISWQLGPFQDNRKPDISSETFSPFAATALSAPNNYYFQSQRTSLYLSAWRKLLDMGAIYASKLSRKDVERALNAPHPEDDSEPVFPPHLRPPTEQRLTSIDSPVGFHWRFQVPDSRVVQFIDRRMGLQSFTAGKDFGDFVVFRGDGICAYELAVVLDDADMGVTEVVRGADLLLSTARQLLLYECLGLSPPAFYHCPLVRDADGRRLAKRDFSKSLQSYRQDGADPAEIRRRLLFKDGEPYSES